MAPEPSTPAHFTLVEQLAHRVWTPDTVRALIGRGLSQPLRCFLLSVGSWTIIGLVVSSAFFSRSLAVFLPFFLLGIFTGLLLPRFLLFKSQELMAARS